MLAMVGEQALALQDKFSIHFSIFIEYIYIFTHVWIS